MVVGITSIVLTWVLFVPKLYCPIWGAVIITVLASILLFFALLFFVYLFNLDEKLLASLAPLFNKIYDKRKRNRQI